MTEKSDYVWRWEGRFKGSAESGARSLFTRLDPHLDPVVRLIGIAVSAPEDYPPSSIVPRGCELDPQAFATVIELSQAHAAQNPLSRMIHSHPAAHGNIDNHIDAISLRDAVLQALAPFDEQDERISFVGLPVQISDWDVVTHLVFIALRLRRQPIEQNSALTQRTYSVDESRSAEIPTSLIEAAAFEYLEACTRLLRLPKPGEGLVVMGSETTEVLRSAGKNLMSVPEWKGSQGHAIGILFETCTDIASMPYEGGEARGGFIVAVRDHPAVSYRVRLNRPVPTRQRKAMRKLIESSDEQISVITDGESVYGLGTIDPGYDSTDEAVFEVRFKDLGIWDLVHDGSVLMRVRHGQPELIRQKIDSAVLKVELLELGVGTGAIDLLLDLVLDTAGLQHGALLIISADADQEAVRLGSLAFRVNPVLLDNSLLRRLTAVDGAVLIDLHGYCHAFGVILDGLAQDLGDPARGARFNSAVRYVHWAESPKLAIVVSDDGYVETLTRLDQPHGRQG